MSKPIAATPVVIPSWLRIEAAALHCSCSPEYLSKCCRKRELEYIKKGRLVFFSVVELDAWMLRDKVARAA